MRDLGENLSDIERARRLSRKLADGRAKWSRGFQAAPQGEKSDFVRFSDLSQPPPPPRMSPRTPAPTTELIEPRSDMVDSWEKLISWAREQLDAEAAFAVDSQGFVIATSGHGVAEGFDGMGAELCFSMEQIERVDLTAGDLIWVDIEFARRRIAGLAVNSAHHGRMILGFLGLTACRAESRELVDRVAKKTIAMLG